MEKKMWMIKNFTKETSVFENVTLYIFKALQKCLVKLVYLDLWLRGCSAHFLNNFSPKKGKRKKKKEKNPLVVSGCESRKTNKSNSAHSKSASHCSASSSTPFHILLGEEIWIVAIWGQLWQQDKRRQHFFWGFRTFWQRVGDGRSVTEWSGLMFAWLTLMNRY